MELIAWLSSTKVRLIDTTSIDPHVFEAVNFGLLTASAELDRPDAGFIGPPLCDVVKGELLGVVAPRMRQNGVRRGFVIEELLQLASIHVDETHCGVLTLGME